MKFEDLKVGLKHSSSFYVSAELVMKFSEVSGDFNPIHLDDDFAKKSIFSDKIVHGMLIGSLISKTIASDLPGSGSIYLNQTLNFLKPIYHNTRVKICIEVETLKEQKKIVILRTTCTVNDILVIDGSAVVKCLT